MYGKSITGDSNSSILSNSEYYITASHMMSSHTTCPWCPSPPLSSSSALGLKHRYGR